MSNEGGSIRGIIRDAQLRPIQDVNVVIESGPSHPDLAAITGDDGSFAFGPLRPGSYVIKAFGSGFSEPITVQVFEGKTAFVEISIDSDRGDDGSEDGDIVDET